MNASDYRQKLLAEIGQRKNVIDGTTNASIELSQDEEQLGKLVKLIGSNEANADQKRSALNRLNSVSFFSPVLPTMTPEFLNVLRGQIEAPDRDLRQRAINTLAALKDEVVQERLLEDLSSDKPEEERIVPTVSALAMLGQDEKTLSTPLLRKIATTPPNEESRAEAVRQMSSDPEASEDLLSLMKDENVPLTTREMIPGMVSEADPVAFLNAAAEILGTSGAENELAPWLVKAAATIETPEAAEAFASTKSVVEELRANAPASFQSAASALLDRGGGSGA